MRKHGLACDNVRSFSVVLADGRFIRASASEHADLFWGLRGGGGGLGVVTSFEFQLHPLQEVLAGLVVHSAERGVEALRLFRDFASSAADEFCGIALIAHAPPLPFIEPEWHGRPVIMFAMCWSGDLVAGERALTPLRSWGSPLVDHVGKMPYAQWQRMQDPASSARTLLLLEDRQLRGPQRCDLDRARRDGSPLADHAQRDSRAAYGRCGRARSRRTTQPLRIGMRSFS